MIRGKIIGTGAYAPKRILTNADLEKMVDTNDAWIQQRSGIRERHIVDEGEATSDLALRAARQALERARDLRQRGHEAYALRLLGEIAAQRQPPDAEAAVAAYRQAMMLADELGMRPLAAHCHLGLGTLYARTGRPEQAHTELSAAMALYRAMDMTFWLSRAEAALTPAGGC
jgi:tetratricopeptide (TPR) repeat protein